MRKALCWILVAVLALCGILSGCAETTTTPSSDSGSSEPKTALKVGSVYANISFDPWAPTSAYNNCGRNNVFDTLITKDGAGNIVPSLADSYEWSEDGLKLTFHLVSGVKFHNGDPVTAEDVKYSIDTARSSDVCYTYFSAIDSVDILDESTVQLALNTPNVALLEVLVTWGMIVDKAVYEPAGDQACDTLETVIGSGPYILTSWTPSESATYVANEEYFKGAPSIKEISVKSITDPTAAVIALETGDIDVYTNAVPAISIPSLKGYDLEVIDVPAQRLYYLGMNWEFGPFVDNNKLRQAVAYAIDRDALNLITNEGLGLKVFYPGQPIYSGYPVVENSGYPFDPDKAKELVKEAGAEGLAFTLSLENSGTLPELATSIQNMLGNVGLNVTVNSMDTNAYMADVFTNGNYDMFISFTTAKTKDLDTVWTMMMSSDNVGQGNSGRYRSEDMDRVLKAGRAESDPAKRAEIYKEGVEIFDRDIPYLALFYEFGNRVINSGLQVEPGMAEYDNFYYYSWK